MNIFWIILVVILVLFYILSPLDFIPDVIPLLGWLDDTLMVGLMAYYLRYKRLPNFIYRLARLFFQNRASGSGTRADTSFEQDNPGTHQAEKGPSVSKDPYEILGVAPGASIEEIQTAYRAAAQQYHPDKVAHLGDEFQALAQEKFIQIQDAYNLLMKKYS
jgi:hypothetical protein